MTDPRNQSFDIPQPTIEIDVEYYDEEQKSKLDEYPTANEIRRIVLEGATIPTAEFLTYYLFHRKRRKLPSWRNFDELSRQIGTALSSLTGWVDFNGRSISTPKNVSPQLPEITEHLGEAAGLSVISAVHGLTAADWGKIPEGGKKSLDFEIASDGGRFVQMEAKGSSTPDDRKKTSSISKQKRDIAQKKDAAHQMDPENRRKVDVRYGTITVMGDQPSVPVRCYLVDPPPEAHDDGPKVFRVIQRLGFIEDWITLISPRSQVAAALNTRLAALQELDDPMQLDGVPLFSGRGEPIKFKQIGGFRASYSSFFATRSRIVDGPAGGIAIQLRNDDFFFFGIQTGLVDIVAGQEFAEISRYQAQSGSIEKTVRCVFSTGRFTKLRLPHHIQERATTTGSYTWFDLSGRIHYSNSGILFGVLPVHEQETQLG